MLFLLVLFSSSFSIQKMKNDKTLLLVVAHPDDETAFAEVLIKYRMLGYQVYQIIATDGKYGVRVTSIPEGDSLAYVRQQESICSAEKMGIEKPIFFSIDRLDTRNGVRNYFNAHHALRDSLTHRIPSINPDFILTFGPDGDSHHTEHIVVGSAVTEIILQQGWVDKYPLYYLAYTKDSFVGLEELGFLDEKYINVEVSYSQEEELIGLEAYKCFQSQFTVEELQEDYLSKLNDTLNKTFFRRFAVKEGKQVGF